MLAKQSWRMLKDPQSLLTRVLRAKYFSKSSLLEAKLGHRPSHSWRSILQGTQLLKQGLKWDVGDGKTIKVWHDPWLSNPPRPARSLLPPATDLLTVSDLMKPNSSMWDDIKLQERVHPEDIPLIKKIRLRLIKTHDTPTWIFKKDGQYKVRSGYHQLTKPGTEHTPANSSINTLWKQLWKLNIPPKIKHFWWRVLHNALPVADNLARRKLKILLDCIFCGDAKESILHLLFQCRFAKEVWELSPLRIQPGQLEGKTSLSDIMQHLLMLKDQTMLQEHLFPFIGWRLWKARNELFFNNKKRAIPDIIQYALMDFNLWKDSQSDPNVLSLHKAKPKVATLQEIMQHTSSLICCADASWTNSSSKAGIGWILLTSQGSRILRGFSSVDPVNSALEAEALALKEALLHVRRLQYKNVIFCGDSFTLYRHLEKITKLPHSLPGLLEIQPYLDDIAAITISSFSFKYICRSDNNAADLLAKTARCQNSPFTISWDY